MQLSSSPVLFLSAHVDGLRGAKQEVGPEVFSQLSSTLPWDSPLLRCPSPIPQALGAA